MKYLIDTSSLIQPSRLYYRFSSFALYWDILATQVTNGNVIISDIVKEEILRGQIRDDLTVWVESFDNSLIVKRAEEKIVNEYKEIIKYIHESGYFTSEAVAEWSMDGIADPWIIAIAKAYKYTIVTNEDYSSHRFSKKCLTKSIKIPNIAEKFGVNCINLFDMIDCLELKIE